MQWLISVVEQWYPSRKILAFINLVIAVWQKTQDLWLVLHYARFSVFVLFLGALLMLIPQGRELALRLDTNLLHFMAFFLGLSFWAAHNWFGSRNLLNERFGRPVDKGSPEYDSLFQISLRHTPRVLGLLAYVFAAIQVSLAWFHKGILNLPYALIFFITVLTGIGFYVLVIKRTELMSRQKTETQNLKMIAGLLMPVTLAYSLFFIAAGVLFPAHIGFWLGSLGLLFFGLSSIVPVGNMAIHYTEKVTDTEYFGTTKSNQKDDKRTGFPVVTALVVYALFLSLVIDNHGVRTLNPSAATAERYTLPEAFAVWEKQAVPNPAGVKPLIIVATAGGGIRAAYWTATVLGGLTDAEPRFRNALFAISGVSGGSVGSAFYLASLRAADQKFCPQPEQTPAKQDSGPSCRHQQLTQTALSQDFLAPNLSNLLYSDLLQRFLPVSIFPDRQQALEEGWELAWRQTYGTLSPGLRAGLSQKPEHGWLPMLMLNSTHIESGQRVVASSMKLDSHDFTDTVDLLTLINQDLSLSTAAGNSARFTYVSPVGTLPCNPDAPDGTPWFCDNGHLVDGGYYENFGAITALQTIKVLQTQLSDDIKKTIKPIFIVISSDPTLTCSQEEIGGDKKNQPFACGSIDTDKPKSGLPSSRWGNEIFGPIKAIVDTRSDRGILAAQELRNWAAVECKQTNCGFGDKPAFVHFRMAVPSGQDEPALGWMLSAESQTLINSIFRCTAADILTATSLRPAAEPSLECARRT